MHGAFTALKAAAEDLAEAITRADRGLPARVYEIDGWLVDADAAVGVIEGAEARARAAEVVRRLQAEDRLENLAGAARLPGVLAANPATLELARTLNAAKDTFKRAVVALPDDIEREVVKKVAPGVHRKHAYRHVVTLPVRPRRLSFVRAASVTHHVALTHAEVGRRIEDLARRCEGDRDPAACLERVAQDRRRLAQLPPGSRFAVVRAVAAHPRINLAFEDTVTLDDGREGKSFMLVTSLPVLVPGHDLPLADPEFLMPPRPGSTGQRARRVDRQKRELFLPPLSLYLVHPG